MIEQPLHGGVPSALLASQLAQAQAEQAALEGALLELPAILEAGFRQRLAALQQANRQLLQEQARLLALVAAPSRRGSRPRWGWLLLVVSCGAGLCLGGWILLGWGALSPMPSRASVGQRRSATLPPSSNSLVVLRAQGPSWVEVQDLRTQEVLFIGVLEAGDSRTIRLRQGLRLRSGRPDLLTLQVDGGAPTALGQSEGPGWRTLLPPGVRTEAA